VWEQQEALIRFAKEVGEETGGGKKRKRSQSGGETRESNAHGGGKEGCEVELTVYEEVWEWEGEDGKKGVEEGREEKFQKEGEIRILEGHGKEADYKDSRWGVVRLVSQDGATCVGLVDEHARCEKKCAGSLVLIK
jgi:hypothetical protein